MKRILKQYIITGLRCCSGFTYFMLMFFISGFLLSCVKSSINIPKAEKGVLDLRDWNFEKNGAIKLDGNWEFYWQQLSFSNDSFSLPLSQNYCYYPVPRLASKKMYTKEVLLPHPRMYSTCE
ncbi:MAG: hypothetical protein JXK07_07865 [Spirochaetes bacterium]|nr:hypothetical protein [Spirochaetota bacterium]MBN2772303.1 hypothetical protein [Spirochaetota bacterium]